MAEALAAPKTPEPTRLLLIRAIGQGGLDVLPDRWLKGLGVALADSHPSVVREAVATIRARKLTGFDRELRELSRQPGLSADLRIAAIESVASRTGPPDAQAFAMLVGQLAGGADPLSRLAAARTLGAGPLAAEQLTQFAGSLKGVGPMVLRTVLPAYAKSSDVIVGTALVACQKVRCLVPEVIHGPVRPERSRTVRFRFRDSSGPARRRRGPV